MTLANDNEAVVIAPSVTLEQRLTYIRASIELHERTIASLRRIIEAHRHEEIALEVAVALLKEMEKTNGE